MTITQNLNRIMFYILFLGIMFLFQNSNEASAQSCWSILTYDKDGNPFTSRNCVDPTEANTLQTESQTKKKLKKVVRSGELLIGDPPFGAKTELRKLGYNVIGKYNLNSIDLEIIQVKTPEGKGVAESIIELRQKFPNAVLDTNDLLDLSSASAEVDPSQEHLPFDRTAVGWGSVDPRCGYGLKIGMVDGSVDVKHASLKEQKVNFKSFIRKGRKETAYEHGTAVAALLVGKPGVDGNPGGLLPGATLYAAGIFEERNGLVKGNLAAMLRSLDWFAQKKVKVINMSIAGGINKIMQLALRKIKQKDIVIVAAAGNNGRKAAPVWPAADPSVIAVTAIDYKLGIYRHANHGNYIDFAAPGVGIGTLTPKGPKNQSGTSFATPYITSVVGLHFQMGFKGDANKLRESMIRYTHDLGEKGKDKIFGHGLVRLRPANC